MRKKLLRIRRKYALNHQRRVRKLKILSRHPFAVPVVTFLCLLILTAVGYRVFADRTVPVSGAYVVIISHDHTEQTVPSREPTVGALLKKLDIKLNPGDVVEPDVKAPINQEDFRINIYRAEPVEIVDGSSRKFAFSAATTPRSVANQVGVNVYPEDDLTVKPSTNFLRDGAIGQRIVIKRATPIKFELYGTPLTARTQAKTVAGMLKEKHISLGKNDTVSPKISTPITADMEVAVVHNGTKVFTTQEEIAPPVKRLYDNNLAYGTTAIRQQGTPGEKIVTYKVTTENGKEVSRQVLQSAIIQQPVEQIVVQGTNLAGIKGDMALAGIVPSDYGHVDFIFSHESHWNPADVNSSGCAGLGQACPGSKLAAACPNWQNDPVCQIRFFNGYAVGRYGSWAGAESAWLRQHWW